MDNVLLLRKIEKLEKLSKELGFSKTFFLEDFSLIEEENNKVLLKKIQQAKQQKKISICIPKTEETLRFLLEKTPADMILGVENIHPKDSVHYPRSGLNQVLCNLAAEKNKIIAFSFRDILQVQGMQRSKLMNRMMFNIKLCQKFKVKMFFSNFSSATEEMRSARDLLSFWQLLGGRKKEEMELSIFF